MTTLAEDRDSWKASGIIRRDFRHTHNGPDVPPHRRKRTRADRKWCRRKVGRLHTPALVERSYAWIHVCTACGKHCGYTWKRTWLR